MSPSPTEIVYSPGEERLHVAASLAGLVGALIYLPFLILRAQQSEWPLAGLGVTLFGAGLILLNGASAAYHALPPGKNRNRARIADHGAIFILIASTYSPFALGPLLESGGKLLFAMEWLLALVGIGFKILGGFKYRKLSNVFYLVMGWLGLLWTPAIIHTMTLEGLWWLVGGGVAYSVGIVFYAAKGKRFTHAIWHIFVLAGTVIHAIAVWRYAL